MQAKQTGKVIESAIPQIFIRLCAIGAIAAFGTSIIAPDLVGGVAEVVQQATETITGQTLEGEPQFSDEFLTPLKDGEAIAGFSVTSPFNPQRKHPVTGQIRPHRGVDLNTPIGTPMYLIGLPGEKITIRCWEDKNGGGWVVTYTSEGLGYEFQYLHLKTKTCVSGEYTAGDKIAESGNTGIGTGAHSHIEVIPLTLDGEPNPKRKRIDPPRGFVKIALTGEIPDFGMTATTEAVEQPTVQVAAPAKSNRRSHPIIQPDPNAKPGAQGNVHQNIDGQDLSSSAMPANGNKYQYENRALHNGEIVTLKNARLGDGKFMVPIRTFTLAYRGYNPGIHGGIDFDAALGSEMVAVADGVVEKVAWDDWGLGYAIKIKHENGYHSIYGHCLDIFVKEGDRVQRGQVIGLVGSTGFSIAPHLHFEMRKNGEMIDPAPYFNLEPIKHHNWNKHMEALRNAM